MEAYTILKLYKTINRIFYTVTILYLNQGRIKIYKVTGKGVDRLYLRAVEQIQNLTDYVDTKVNRRSMSGIFFRQEILCEFRQIISGTSSGSALFKVYIIRCSQFTALDIIFRNPCLRSHQRADLNMELSAQLLCTVKHQLCICIGHCCRLFAIAVKSGFHDFNRNRNMQVVMHAYIDRIDIIAL